LGGLIVDEASRVRLVVFMVEGARYAVPLSAVERAYAMAAVSPLPGSPPVVLGIINLHGRPVAVVDPRRRLGLPPRDYGLAAHLLIARTPRRTLAIPTDEVLGVVELDAAAVTPAAAVAPGLQPAGVVALPDGLLLIHDLDAFLTPAEEGQIDRALETGG
jgi:purine-binding chemotaxis protein CheW